MVDQTRFSRYSFNVKGKYPVSYRDIVDALTRLYKKRLLVPKDELRSLFERINKNYTRGPADDLLRLLGDEHSRILIRSPEDKDRYYFDPQRAVEAYQKMEAGLPFEPPVKPKLVRITEILERHEARKKTEDQAKLTALQTTQKVGAITLMPAEERGTTPEISSPRQTPQAQQEKPPHGSSRVLFLSSWEHKVWKYINSLTYAKGELTLLNLPLEIAKLHEKAGGTAMLGCTAEQFLDMIHRLREAKILRRLGKEDETNLVMHIEPERYLVIDVPIPKPKVEVCKEYIDLADRLLCGELNFEGDWEVITPPELNSHTVHNKFSFRLNGLPYSGWGIVAHKRGRWHVGVKGFQAVVLVDSGKKLVRHHDSETQKKLPEAVQKKEQTTPPPDLEKKTHTPADLPFKIEEFMQDVQWLFTQTDTLQVMQFTRLEDQLAVIGQRLDQAKAHAKDLRKKEEQRKETTARLEAIRKQQEELVKEQTELEQRLRTIGH